MGVISSDNQTEFVSCKSLFAQIREDMDSFDAQGLIDNRTMYRYVKKVLADIGLSAYMEKDGILEVSRYKTQLPEDFSQIYGAWRVTSESPISSQRVHPQTGFVMYLENTCETIEHCKCDIERVVDKITVRTYIQDDIEVRNYRNPQLLSLSTATRNKWCAMGSPNMYHGSSDQINIDNGVLNTNFESGSIYLQYFGFPFDNEGTPMIPDDEHIKYAIESYIKFKLLEKWWYNNDVVEVERKKNDAKMTWLGALKDARYKSKLPSFQTLLEYRRKGGALHGIFQF